MPSIKGTKTEVNILTAFAGESQARNRYTFFSSQAKKDGFVQVSKLFAETADQEKEHAERLFKFLEGGEVKISAGFPAGVIASTLENLVEAANGEKEEYTAMYPEFAKIADAEGFAEVAAVMRNIAVAEKHHEARYINMIKEIKDGTMFRKSSVIVWECLNCGYLHTGTEAPEKCPACAHPRDYFAPNRPWKAVA